MIVAAVESPIVMHTAPEPVSSADEQTLRRIADYERISAILWICLGVFQVVMVVTLIAGAWNIYAGWSRLALPEQIRARKAHIPAAFEDVTSLIVIGVLNLILGGVVGILFVAFDFVVRDMVLRNRHLFTEIEGAAAR